MVTDTIADLLTRIRNAQLRKNETISLPSSRMLVSLAQILKEEGFINDYEIIEDKDRPERKTLEVRLRYEDGEGVIRALKRISKPGVRVYVGYREIPKVKNNLGIAIISTPKGIITGMNAKKQKVGGEFLCTVW